MCLSDWGTAHSSFLLLLMVHTIKDLDHKCGACSERVFDVRLKKLDFNTKALKGLQKLFRKKERNQNHSKERQSNSFGEIWLVSGV